MKTIVCFIRSKTDWTDGQAKSSIGLKGFRASAIIAEYHQNVNLVSLSI